MLLDRSRSGGEYNSIRELRYVVSLQAEKPEVETREREVLWQREVKSKKCLAAQPDMT